MNGLNKFQSEQFDYGLNKKASFLQLPGVISFFILIFFLLKRRVKDLC